MGDLKTCEVCYNTIREREDKTEFHKVSYFGFEFMKE